jgi:hypothetical protein
MNAANSAGVLVIG